MRPPTLLTTLFIALATILSSFGITYAGQPGCAAVRAYTPATVCVRARPVVYAAPVCVQQVAVVAVRTVQPREIVYRPARVRNLLNALSTSVATPVRLSATPVRLSATSLAVTPACAGCSCQSKVNGYTCEADQGGGADVEITIEAPQE